MHILKPQSYAHKLQKLFLSLNHRNSKMIFRCQWSSTSVMSLQAAACSHWVGWIQLKKFEGVYDYHGVRGVGADKIHPAPTPC